MIYKSQMDEPQNEQAVVNNEDEKTLVEESINESLTENLFESNNAPKLSKEQALSILGNKSASNAFPKEVTDPTIRKTSPPPTKAATKSSPYENIVQDLNPSADKVATSKKSSYSNPQKSGFQLIAGLLVLGLISILTGHFLSGNALASSGSLAVGVSSMSMGLIWIITSDYGYVRPNIPTVVGVGSVIGIIIGALSFGDVQQESSALDVEEKQATYAPLPIKLGKNKEVAAISVPEPAAKKSSVQSKTGTKNLISAQVETQAKASSRSPKVNEIVPELDDRDEEVELDAIPDEPIEDFEDLGDDFGDLGLDEEPEDKKGRFARKEKDESKPEVKAADIKVDIPTSVLDIIIRNNKDVKGCYIQQRKETGSFPSSVKVIFTLQPNGKVSSAYISDGPYVGSKFEICLRAAFKGMTFPPFDTKAKPQSLSYTLKL